MTSMSNFSGVCAWLATNEGLMNMRGRAVHSMHAVGTSSLSMISTIRINAGRQYCPEGNVEKTRSAMESHKTVIV